jgi:hypothetical protein
MEIHQLSDVQLCHNFGSLSSGTGIIDRVAIRGRTGRAMETHINELRAASAVHQEVLSVR